jgi:hypothetical protein
LVIPYSTGSDLSIFVLITSTTQSSDSFEESKPATGKPERWRSSRDLASIMKIVVKGSQGLLEEW